MSCPQGVKGCEDTDLHVHTRLPAPPAADPEPIGTGLPIVDRIIEETVEAIRDASRREIASALRRVADGLEKEER